MRVILLAIAFCTFRLANAANSYIEFRQFDKVSELWIGAGVLYACSKDESVTWEKRHSYQFFYFKLHEIADEYFRIAYRTIAVQDLPVADRTAMIDEHRAVEAKRSTLEQAGFDGAQRKEVACEAVMGLVTEVMKHQQ